MSSTSLSEGDINRQAPLREPLVTCINPRRSLQVGTHTASEKTSMGNKYSLCHAEGIVCQIGCDTHSNKHSTVLAAVVSNPLLGLHHQN